MSADRVLLSMVVDRILALETTYPEVFSDALTEAVFEHDATAAEIEQRLLDAGWRHPQ